MYLLKILTLKLRVNIASNIIDFLKVYNSTASCSEAFLQFQTIFSILLPSTVFTIESNCARLLKALDLKVLFSDTRLNHHNVAKPSIANSSLRFLPSCFTLSGISAINFIYTSLILSAAKFNSCAAYNTSVSGPLCAISSRSLLVIELLEVRGYK